MTTPLIKLKAMRDRASEDLAKLQDALRPGTCEVEAGGTAISHVSMEDYGRMVDAVVAARAELARVGLTLDRLMK